AVVVGEQPAVVVQAEQAGEEPRLFPPLARKGIWGGEHARRVCPLQERGYSGQALPVEVKVEAGIPVSYPGWPFLVHRSPLGARRGSWHEHPPYFPSPPCEGGARGGWHWFSSLWFKIWIRPRKGTRDSV